MLEGKSYSENQIYYGVLNLKKNHARVKTVTWSLNTCLLGDYKEPKGTELWHCRCDSWHFNGQRVWWIQHSAWVHHLLDQHQPRVKKLSSSIWQIGVFQTFRHRHLSTHRQGPVECPGKKKRNISIHIYESVLIGYSPCDVSSSQRVAHTRTTHHVLQSRRTSGAWGGRGTSARQRALEMWSPLSK